MKIYTKFGDQGKTRLVGGECVNKDNPRVECYGTVDELNSFMGLTVTLLRDNSKKLSPDLTKMLKEMIRIQHELFNLGSLLACQKEETLPQLPHIENEHIEALEKSIDQMTAKLPPLTQFILPGGSLLGSYLHVARTVCRRAERHTVGLLQNSQRISSEERRVLEKCLIYLNRLSDFLFTAARFGNLKLGYKDQAWEKNI